MSREATEAIKTSVSSKRSKKAERSQNHSEIKKNLDEKTILVKLRLKISTDGIQVKNNITISKGYKKDTYREPIL